MLLSDLNEKQHEAVTAPLGAYLILAGAGSGKTRVLVHRIAWLVSEHQVSPFGIMSVTFTNKAAGEMRERLEKILGRPTRGMWVGTFHSLSHRILRSHWQQAELPENFQILDSDDQLRLIKRVMRELEFDEKQWAPRQLQWYINGQKEQGCRANQAPEAYNVQERVRQRVYETYEAVCQQNGYVDFSELLLRAYELWTKHPDILAQYRERFKHILVDEFQDTNTLQYAWLKLLAGDNAHIMAVGDDDQSIYGWRGANVENLHRFQSDFKQATVIRLEQNYRSTATILKAANALITNNDNRMGKELWTSGEEGERIHFYPAYNEQDEAQFIVNKIEDFFRQGYALKDMAILYRSNAQSRVLEEALLSRNKPYRVYGGLRFFDRAEIKDTLAYLRLLQMRDDDAAFERVVNLPTRGIGAKTLDQVREVARAQKISLWAASNQLLEQEIFTARAHKALTGFIELIDEMDSAMEGAALSSVAQHVMHHSGLWQLHTQNKGERAIARKENLEEFLTATQLYTKDPDDDIPELAAFLSHVALESGDNQSEAEEDCVQLMTLHSAKGLEFPIVFIAGLEEGLFPHQMSLQEEGRLEEERRLCYVGMTRAMQKLYLSSAELRYLHGKQQYHRPSRFLREIPRELLEEIRPKQFVSRTQSATREPATSSSSVDFTGEAASDTGLVIGQVVVHDVFGEGVVTNFEGHGAHARVEVNFAREGRKWLVAAYAKLKPAVVP
jgi:ATP-dependent DNA helicase UvrD/PcrA